MSSTKTIFFLVLLICSCQLLTGQITFNKRYGLNSTSARFYSLAEVPNGYVVTGMKTDGTNHPFSVHLDAYGEVLEIHDFEFEGLNANLFESALQPTPQGELVNIGSINDDNGIHKGVVFWFDETGDTIRTVRNYSDIYLNDIPVSGTQGWYTPRDLCLDDEGNLYELSAFARPYGIVRKRDPEGNILWTYQFEIDDDNAQMEIHNISWYEGLLYFNVMTVYWFDPAVSSMYILDSEDGSVILDMELVDEIDQHHQIIPLSGSYLIAGRQGFPGAFGTAPSFYRLSNTGELIWSRIVGDADASFAKYCQEIVQINDEEYVCACPSSDNDPVPENIYGPKNDMVAIIKFTPEGEILWERKYMGFERPYDSHDLHALIQTSDGGFAFCGVSGDWNEDHPDYVPPSQQGWLVKLDEHGCLEPGCQFLNIDQIAFDGEGTLEVFPNPSSGAANIRFSHTDNSNQRSVVIFDAAGKRVEETQLSPGQQQIEVNQLSSGVYNVHLVIDNILIDSAKLVIQQ